MRGVDLQARRAVWEALSSLFLDTDTSLDREWRAKLLAASPYSVPELEQILIDHVYPVCRANLFSIAGEWSGFDPEWLEKRIMRRLQSPFRALHWLDLGRLTIHLSWSGSARKPQSPPCDRDSLAMNNSPSPLLWPTVAAPGAHASRTPSTLEARLRRRSRRLSTRRTPRANSASSPERSRRGCRR